MKRVNFINDNYKKIKYLLILGGIILFVFTFFPTLGRYVNRTSYYDIAEWDGSVASSYSGGSGSEIDPYIISNGREFAYFAEQLKYTDYKNVYFELSNDIVLNKGLFDYDGTISYTVNDSIYQITEYTNKYNGGNVNKFSTMNDFNGHLNGNFYRIYGLYMTSSASENLALFESIGGSVKDLYISNAFIYGGYNSSILSIDTEPAIEDKKVSISNVMIDGFVIGNESDLVKEYVLDDITSGNLISLSNYSYLGKFISSKLTGVFSPLSEDNVLIINGSEFTSGEFSIDLDNVNDLSYELAIEEEYTLSNLKFIITSDYGVSSSFVVNSNNTVYTNVVNKASVISSDYASGFIYSTIGDLNITNGYNAGFVSSENASGLITYVNSGNVNITGVYNRGEIISSNNSLFISKVNNGSVAISNSFVTSEDYIINEIVDGNVSVDNGYALNTNNVKSGSISGSFNVISLDEIKNSSFTTLLQFNSFVSLVDVLTNNDNVWVFEKNSYPILYIDDLNRPVAKINVSIYSWNTFANDLDTHKFASEFVFSINTTDALAGVKSIEYYLHKSTGTLTIEDINGITDWETYKDVVKITNEGSYVIYAKITDIDENVTYINSDILIINSENTIANVTLGDYKWGNVVLVPKYIYIDKSEKLIVNVNDEYVNIENVSYYITSELLKESELDDLSEVWNEYSDGVSVVSNDNNIYYFKIVDNNGNVNYISTDYLTLDGYNMNDIYVGREKADDGVTISNKSRISFNYSYSDSNLFVDGYTHNVVTNILLPAHTHITFIDNINNKVYKYKTTSDSYGYDDVNKKAIYPINLFNEIGTLETMLLNESIYSGEINEDFTVILDFKDTTFTDDFSDVKVLFEVNDSEGKRVIPTLVNGLKTFNVKNSSSSLSISSEFNGFIDYNKDTSSVVDFKIDLSHSNDVIDTTYQDKRYGLEIRMVDNNTSSLMGKSYLSNIQFKYNDKTYMPYTSGIINIDLEDINEGNVIIDTFVNNNKLDGDYSLYLCPYISYDGVNYSGANLSKCINIPLNVSDNYKVDYKLDVVIPSNDRIFMKNQDKTLNFEMLYQSEIENPNIRISLYEKKEYTAYNQNYKLVDLGEYIYDKLEFIDNNTYYFLKDIESSGNYNMYSLSFKNSLFNLNGYKLVFDLYDGNNKIGSIEKKFIVKGDE